MDVDDSVVQASAAHFLIDGGEEDAANVLLSCELRLSDSGDSWWAGDEQIWAVHVALTGPRIPFEILRDSHHSITEAIKKAIAAVLPQDAELIEIDPAWRTELIEIARGLGVHNQPCFRWIRPPDPLTKTLALTDHKK